MGYLWGWHVTEKTGIISACKVSLHYIILYSSLAFLLLGVVVDLLSCVSSLFFFFRLTPPTRWRPSPLLVGCYSLSMHLQYFLKFRMFYNSLDGASGLLLVSWWCVVLCTGYVQKQFAGGRDWTPVPLNSCSESWALTHRCSAQIRLDCCKTEVVHSKNLGA